MGQGLVTHKVYTLDQAVCKIFPIQYNDMGLGVLKIPLRGGNDVDGVGGGGGYANGAG